MSFIQTKEKKMNNKKMLVFMIGLILIALTACAPASAPSNFPTGRFMLPGNDFVGIQFNEDGTWYGINYGQHDPTGTYSVKGDLFIEESNNYNCGESPMSFRYTFDGSNLKFELTEDSMGDICEGRKAAYDGTTYVLTK
jgi:hypothetical protein